MNRFDAENDRSSRRLVAAWMKHDAGFLRSKALNARTRFTRSDIMGVYAERYAKLMEGLAEVLDEDAKRLLEVDNNATAGTR